LTSDGHITLADVIRRSLPELTRAEPPRWVETNLLQGRFALLFDGLDEIQSADGRREASSWLDEQNRSGGGNLIVVTSRKFGYHDNPLTDAIVVQVRPFTDSQVVSFVERWYAATAARSYGDDNQSARISAQSGSAELLSRLHQKQVLNELASNPLLLTMIVNVHYYSGALPGSRSELYRQICDVFLGRRHQARGIAVEIPAARKSLVLRGALSETRATVCVTCSDAGGGPSF